MDIEKKREQTRERVKRYRGKENVTLKDVTHPDVTLIAHAGVTLLHRPNDPDYDPEEKLYNSRYYNEETLRYLGPLSDGQVLDRLSVVAGSTG